MQVSNVSIIKTDSVKSAITLSINESYSAKYVEEFNNLLVIDGNVGSCVEVKNESYATVTTTTYFVVTVIGGGMYRVEHCCASDIDYNKGLK